MDGFQALQAGTVRPPEGKPAASEGADGEVRGSRSSFVRMRDMDPPEVPLRQAPYNTPQDVASNCRSLVQVAEQAHPLVQICPSPNPMREHRNNRTHEEVVVGGGATPMGDHRLPKRVMSGELENTGKRGLRGKEKEWTDCVADDLRLFGVTGDWRTAALDPGAWYNTIQEGSCRFMAAWVRGEENASNRRQKKTEAEEADKVEVAPGVTVASLRRFRTALIGPTQGFPKRRRLCR